MECEVRTNKTEQTHDTAEDLNDEDLDEQIGVGSICKGCRRTCDAHTDATKEVACANSETPPKQRESCERS